MRAKKTDCVTIDRLTKADGVFNSLKWVIKAMSRDVTRRSVNGVNIDGNRIVCTDGHRLHLAKIDDFAEPGLYAVEVNNQCRIVLSRMTDVDFPLYERVIPADPADIRIVGIYDENDIQFLNQDIVEAGIVVNLNYLKDIFDKGGRIETEIRLSETRDKITVSKLRPVHFLMGDREAILMPMNRRIMPSIKRRENDAGAGSSSPSE